MEYIVFATLFLTLTYFMYTKTLVKKRERFIKEYKYPATINKKVLSTYPHLTENDVDKVIIALREYFSVCNSARKKMVAMPSRVVDVAWHEFILFTRDYKEFCNRGLGNFLHHTPAEAMITNTIAQDSIKRAWRLSCVRENIPPKAPHKLPLLFSIDTELNIPDGFKYSLNCDPTKVDGYCAAHIGCGGGFGGGGCAGDGDGGCGGGGE